MVFDSTKYSNVEELPGSMTLDATRKRTTGTRIVKCNWADAIPLLQDFLPDPSIVGQDNLIPLADEYPASRGLLVASAVKVEPYFPENIGIVSGSTFPARYDYAKLTVTYETPEFNQTQAQAQANNGPGGSSGSTGQSNSKDTFITHKISVSADFLTWPSGMLESAGTADPSSTDVGGQQSKIPEDQKLAVLLPLLEHNITWHFVSFPPWQAIRWLIGNVNAYWFAGAPPETLLFSGMEASRDVTSQGVQCWTMSYKFLEKNMNQLDQARAFGWNHYVRVNGFNSGSFQIVDRKRPSGYTTLREALSNASGGGDTLKVVSRASFPRGAVSGFYVRIGDEVISVGPTLETNDWAIVGRGQRGTAAAAHAVGASIVSTYISGHQSTTLQNFPYLSSVRYTNDVFPMVGQFFVSVNGTRMLVNRKPFSDGTLLGVLPNVRLYADAPKAVTGVEMLNSPVYPLGDFRYLYVSGLVFGFI